MKSKDTKKFFKKIIKECLYELLIEEGVISGMITEVAKGLGGVQRKPAVKEAPRHKPSFPQGAEPGPKSDFDQMRRQMLEEVGRGSVEETPEAAAPQLSFSSPSVASMFEGTAPLEEPADTSIPPHIDEEAAKMLMSEGLNVMAIPGSQNWARKAGVKKNG